MIEWLAKKTASLLPKAKIVRKLFLGYVLIVLLPITILAYFLYNQAHDRFLEEYMRSRQELIEQANSNLKVDLTQVESVYQMFQYNPYVLEYLSGEFKSEVDNVYNLVKNIRPIFSYVYVGNPQIVEISLYCSDPNVHALGPEFRRMDEFIENYQQHYKVMDLGPGKGVWLYDQMDSNKLPQLSYYQKIYNRRFTKQVGIMEVKITDDIIMKLIEKVKTTPNDQVFMMSGKGDALYSELLHAQELNAIKRAAESFNNNRSGHIYIDQKNLVGNMVNVEPLGINIISFTTQKDVNPKKELQWLALGGMVCLLLLSIIYYWIATSLTRRILKLARHMRRVDSNNFTTYVDNTKDRDEINFLASSYNALLLRIDELVNTVHREELLRKEADYKVLQAQIRPHFLYNTLESIRMMAEMKGTPEVADFTHTFGKLIRYSLSNNKSETTLKDELDHVRDFLVIHKNRVGERLHFEIEVNASIGGFVCPRFILQPLVENSIVHGLSKRRKQWLVRIQVYETELSMFVEITDNGIGIEEDRLRMIHEILEGKRDLSGLLTDSSGIGMYNVHERIKSFYGKASGLTLTSYPEQGTTCVIQMHKGDQE